MASAQMPAKYTAASPASTPGTRMPPQARALPSFALPDAMARRLYRASPASTTVERTRGGEADRARQIPKKARQEPCTAGTAPDLPGHAPDPARHSDAMPGHAPDPARHSNAMPGHASDPARR